VNLLKKVCERGEWVSSKLVDAYEFAEKQPDRAALLFLKLAEAGHEVAQMNVAHLLDSGHSMLLYSGSTEVTADQSQTDEGRQYSRIVAQRYYEMSAEQGSASSELRLGDYAYYGWGISAGFWDDDTVESFQSSESEDDTLPAVFTSNEPELKVHTQSVDYEASLARYRKTAEMTVTGEWMQAFVARGSFNLGYMHQFGMGVAQDLHLAKRHYHRCREVDPGGIHAPITMVLLLLGAHMQFLRMPPKEELCARLVEDIRVHILLLHFIAIVTLIVVRWKFAAARARPQLAAAPAPGLAAGTGAGAAAALPVAAAGAAE